MKLNWIAEWKVNEVEIFAWVVAVIFIVMFLLGAFWDNIVGVQMVNNRGLGLYQILWCVFWGLLSVYGMLIATRWGE